jgi:hypothetical protein
MATLLARYTHRIAIFNGRLLSFGMSRKADASRVDLVSLQGTDAKLLAGLREMPFGAYGRLPTAMV